MKTFLCAPLVLCCVTTAFAQVTELPEHVDTFFGKYCLDCHDEHSAEGDINLDFREIDWTDHQSANRWAKVWKMIDSGDMPPEDTTQPKQVERDAAADWLCSVLLENDKPGGTILRRLSKEEYENSVTGLLKQRFTVPLSFPADSSDHGFDNHGGDLVLSPPLMAQYLEIATAAADRVLPPPVEQRSLNKKTTVLAPEDFTLNFTTGHLVDGVLRMVLSTDSLARGSVWPSRFEAKTAGVYRVKIEISYFKPTKGHTPEVHLLAHSTNGKAGLASQLTKLATFTITEESPATFSADVELQRGDTIVVHYENAPLYGVTGKPPTWAPQFPRVAEQLIDMWRNDPELGAAWVEAGYQRGDAGWTWHKRIEAIREKRLRSEGGLDADAFNVDSPEVKEIAEEMASHPFPTVRTMSCYLFEKGPGIDIHRMAITGPIRLIADREDMAQEKITARFMGERAGRDDREYAEAILRPLIDTAFRRPATDAQVEEYVTIALQHQANGHRFEDGIHLAFRAVLCSPNFLYRGQREGQLDDYDLATRLSFFLTSSPPDTLLQKLANKGQLSDQTVLEEQTRRLLKDKGVKNFLTSFTGQWLNLRILPDIMPDSRLLKWTDKHTNAITAETELFVAEILRENFPIETFIDPNFTYLNQRNATLYNIEFPKSDTMTRVDIEPGGRHGGILGQASVMMATANGVDTQPVLRGVWLLENILGDPVPEPPSNIPAVEPDTTGAKSIRELLQKHNADPSCAACHQKIDPPGFALENFDPVGRWREFYPVYKKVNGKVVRKDGPPVDSKGTMKDGTVLNDVTDLKHYLVNNIDIFGNCLAEKLLVYATGRDLSFGDRKEVERLVREVREGGNGFQDLVVALVLSESFRTK